MTNSKITDGRFCYSMDGELYEGDCKTKEEAIKEAISEYELKIGDSIFIGEKEEKFFNEYLDLDVLFESMADRAADEVHPDAVDGWPFDLITNNAQKELDDFITSWVKKHNLNPYFYGIKNPEEIKITKTYEN